MKEKETIKKIKKCMREKGLNQSDLATKLNTTRSVISNWFNGVRNPSIHNLKKIAEVLEIDLHKLLNDNLFIETNDINSLKEEIKQLHILFETRIKNIEDEVEFLKKKLKI